MLLRFWPLLLCLLEQVLKSICTQVTTCIQPQPVLVPVGVARQESVTAAINVRATHVTVARQELVTAIKLRSRFNLFDDARCAMLVNQRGIAHFFSILCSNNFFTFPVFAFN